MGGPEQSSPASPAGGALTSSWAAGSAQQVDQLSTPITAESSSPYDDPLASVDQLAYGVEVAGVHGPTRPIVGRVWRGGSSSGDDAMISFERPMAAP